MVISALLKLIGIPEDIIRKEFALSEGAVAYPVWKSAMEGFGKIGRYLNRIRDPEAILRVFRSSLAQDELQGSIPFSIQIPIFSIRPKIASNRGSISIFLCCM